MSSVHPSTRIHRVPAAAPDDLSGLERLVATGALDPSGILAILGKTEGNGCVNDFTRGFATRALADFLRARIGNERAADVVLVMSGGTEGALSPHWLVFERVEHGEGDAFPDGSLAIGTSVTRDVLPEEIGRAAQMDVVRSGVVDAMAAAGITSVDDVHFVQVKCPLLTSARIVAAAARGRSCAVSDTLKSMGLSRGASALGIALALGELDAAAIFESAVGRDMNLFSRRASTSAGIELMGHEILVLGMSRGWRGPLAVGHAVMRDAIDAAAVQACLQGLGVPDGAGFEALLAKAEASRTGLVRGARHTMNDDSDISATRHARAFVGGMLAGLTGTTELFVSGGAEHQGPDGGGPVAVIVRRNAS
ncbi:ring-opening amidohydrolase [Aureimonas jatrophae]|uniref:Cyanuric acid amidohydrolase n=1 Tax=Aureimonas jatrophae TaxID=1166073 RepID=A0A1H0DIM2_9HYPH|nr:ring-opening amidohydrolase [Aureimonas jatrophae]MBB3951906.1 cyanuric acid amidohydrolase [Aureimonas jatrophae]SDN69861.1 cyanuric acid amidohydrolase [Aureimonas jatrophae]